MFGDENKKTKMKKKMKKIRTITKNTICSTSANFDFGQFDFGQLAEVELAEVELAEVEHPHPGHTWVEIVVVAPFTRGGVTSRSRLSPKIGGWKLDASRISDEQAALSEGGGRTIWS